MITTLKHPQIEDLLKLSQASSKIFFSYNDTCKDFLQTYISEKLFRNESLLITVDKIEDVDFLLDKTSVFHPFVHVYNRSILSIQSVSKLRVRAKKNVNLLHVINHEQLENQINALVHDILLIYKNSYSDHQNNIKLPALLQQALQSKIDYHLPILEYYLPDYVFDYTQSELSEFSGIMKWVSSAYKHNYKAFGKTPLNVSSQLDYENYLQIAEHQLSNANELCLLFLNNLNNFKDVQSQDLRERKLKANTLLDQIRSIRDKSNRVNKNISNPKGNSLLSKIASSVTSKQKHSGYQESLELDFDAWLEDFKHSFPALYQEFYMLEESTLEPNIINAEKILAKKVSELLSQYNHTKNAKLEQLNIHNCPDIFKSIYEELNKFYSEVKESSIISIDHNDRSFNLINNYNFLLEIRNQLNEIFLLISNNPDYYHWLQKLNSLSEKERILVDTFIQFFPKTEQWNEIFENFYFHSSVKSKHSHSIGLETKLAELNALQKKYLTLSTESIDSVCNRLFSQEIEELKNSQPEIYKSYFKKKYVSTNQNFAGGGDVTLLKKLFPITIITKDNIEQIQHSFDWDYHIHMDSSKFETHKTTVPPLGAKYVYIKHPVDEYHLNNHLKQDNAYWVKHDIKEYVKHPKLQTDQDQLNFARSLSSKLEDYLDCIQIFQIEGQYIISFLDKRVLGIFLNMYEKYTIKKFVVDHDLNYSLSDILLAGAENITVLIQDHLLDPYSYDSFQWQRYLIQLMTRAGLTCKDISYAHIINKNYEQLQIPIQTRYSTKQKELKANETVVN